MATGAGAALDAAASGAAGRGASGVCVLAQAVSNAAAPHKLARVHGFEDLVEGFGPEKGMSRT